MSAPSFLASNTLESLAAALAAGQTTSRLLIEAALEAVAADGRAFTFVDQDGARAAADLWDRRRQEGVVPSPFAGLPISVKDLFDLRGQSTPAGSLVLRHGPKATADAPTLSRLLSSGFIVIGRTQMSEFAFTGLGLNPHAPLPPNPTDPARVPGGSSGGAAVSVALGQACAGIGTDTGGSVRIPASFCGLVGFKPTQGRLTREGALPLSTSLDSIGPIAHSVRCCRVLDAFMADEPSSDAPAVDPAKLTLGVPSAFVVTQADEAVATPFNHALSRLSAAGAAIKTFAFPEIDAIPQLCKNGSLSNAEAFAWHRRRDFFGRRDLYDPNVLPRIEAGALMSAADYIDLITGRAAMIAQADQRTQTFDAVLFPTTALLAPAIETVLEPQAFSRINDLVLKTPSVVNFLDRCAISVPMRIDGAVPCGLTLMGERFGDARLLAVAQALEAIIR